MVLNLGAGKTPCKVLVVGLDVGDGDLVTRWCASGHLPHLASLLPESNACTPLRTTAETLHVSGWPTFYTGASVGEHGVYYTFQPRPGVQGYRRFAGDQYGRPTFWKLLGDAGLRCTILDAPYTHPERGFRGSQVFDWGTWAHYWRGSSTPGRVWRQLRRECGPYVLGMEAHDTGFAELDPAALGPRLVEAVRQKGRASCWLARQEPWDLFLTVFGETHLGAHSCWNPELGKDQSANLDLRRVYEAVDQALGSLLEEVGDETAILVVSPDGAGPNHSGWHLLPDVLVRGGFLAAPESPQPAHEENAENEENEEHESKPEGRTNLVKRLRDLVPKSLRKDIARRLPTALRTRLAQRVDHAQIRWEETRAYCLPTDLEGCIRINLRGREPAGIVADGAEYNAVCDEITALLETLTDPSTGRPAVRKVVRTERVFPGSRLPLLPDLIVLWSDESAFTALESDATGLVYGSSPDARTGTHRAPGFLLARTEDGTRSGLPEDLHVADIAPALLRHFGVTDVTFPARKSD